MSEQNTRNKITEPAELRTPTTREVQEAIILGQISWGKKKPMPDYLAAEIVRRYSLFTTQKARIERLEKEIGKKYKALRQQTDKAHVLLDGVGVENIIDEGDLCGNSINIRLEHYLAAHRWIPIAEGLPEARSEENEYSERVLVCNKRTYSVYTDWYLTKKKQWHKKPITPYTHWMPIPTLPKGE